MKVFQDIETRAEFLLCETKHGFASAGEICKVADDDRVTRHLMVAAS